MASVSLKLLQAGSGTTAIHAEPGDNLAFLLPATVSNDVLAACLAGSDQLTRVTGVTCSFDATGDGDYPLTITQSGSGTTAIDCASGDTVTVELASVVKNDIMAAFVTYLGGLGNIAGVTFPLNLAGGAT